MSKTNHESPITNHAGPEGRLKLTEIFCSLQGESRSVGWPTVFVRLTGCPLRCTWCDTTYSFQGGQWWSIEDILSEVARHGARHVCVTGGEPLAQKRCLDLLTALCDAGHEVSLETSGALDIGAVDPRVSRVMDLKAPGSGEIARNRLENIALLTEHDQLKFVLADRADFDWAVGMLGEHRLTERCEVLFSPVWESLPPAELAQWVLDAKLAVRMQVQLHKILWGESPGR
ncbi:7-carboxy-7-deazaguanine synthase QueE [Pseudomarimonas salicorniae]|uniref:7-carboxy-7-deazaguanine synthase n=1 Tax=Pseudomarimonas salicorniae TaxID=2933270 RepID=A0ABT0GDL2_9GAMM|nr:7-carboxy-7-deazaguanine synthase QueE [Lysobacter sp. CAU 1642]MCK7592638.1 7-carboxy-7-deazaguanine synthase QueE [Lysobacter sp. CAU 1642]